MTIIEQLKAAAERERARTRTRQQWALLYQRIREAAKAQGVDVEYVAPRDTDVVPTLKAKFEGMVIALESRREIVDFANELGVEVPEILR